MISTDKKTNFMNLEKICLQKAGHFKEWNDGGQMIKKWIEDILGNIIG
jgi:hypothetical protein